MSFSDHEQLSEYFKKIGVTRAYFKMLAENDNSKQQIYLGGSFDVLQQLPFGEITEYPDNHKPNYKATVDFYWINDELNYSRAPETKLILYPKYPEVRLSGFLSGCATAPSKYMQPVPKELRQTNNGKDGRILIMGVTPDKKIYGYLAPKNTAIAESIINELVKNSEENKKKILNDFPLTKGTDNDKKQLISKLKELVAMNWIQSVRMFPDGSIQPYSAPNGGGYTMEAMFGIIPNGDPNPDYCGWELKAHKNTTLTLMTPEPDKGFYREHGAKEFAIKYGHLDKESNKYFTGPFYIDKPCKKSELKLILTGFNTETGKIDDVSGGILLVEPDGTPVAIWSFSALLKHWCNKHQHACYTRYKRKSENGIIYYQYSPIIHLGEGTEFPLFLNALTDGYIRYDPAIKVTFDANGNSKGKARSQFRIALKNLNNLYDSFSKIDINEYND